MREMKDSGIEWIGNVPATWERCKIKNVISSIGSGTTPTSSNIDYYNSEDICWIQSGDLYKTSYISNTAVSLSAKALHLSALQIYAAPLLWLLCMVHLLAILRFQQLMHAVIRLVVV